MKILWLGFAEEDLDSIYQFYADNNSRYFANKLYNQILDTFSSNGTNRMGSI